jgi:membrane associated rhomboid family serine protease/Flp pilus assembly protein TadD
MQEAEPPHFPIVVGTVLILNLLVFVVQTVTGGSTNTFNLVRMGAQHGPSIEGGEYWRFVTAAFLHIGILHLLVNSLCLWQLGRLLEHLFGATHFAFLYLIAGVGGTVCSFFMNELVSPGTVSAGASGAIFGVAGAMLVAGLRYSDQIPESLQRAFGTGALPFLVFSLYYGFTRSGIDNYAHIGGALAGAVCGWVLHPHSEEIRQVRTAAVGLVALAVICFGLQYGAVRRYDNHLAAAQNHLNRGDTVTAERELAPVLKRGIQDARVLTLSGIVKVRQGKAKEGITTLARATRLAPSYIPPHLALGEALLTYRGYQVAAVEFRNVIRLDPGNARGYVGLGEALRGQNRLEEAGTAFREALRLNPKLASAHFGLGVVLSQQERFDEAVAHWKIAVQHEPDQVAPHRALARFLLSRGELDEAAKEIREILRIAPNDEWATATLAELQSRK